MSCPQPEIPPVDFRSIALEHIIRDFVVSATRQARKEGFHGWNSYNLIFDAAGVDRFLARNPQCATSNVAVCGSAGMHYKADKVTLEGNLLILDVDAGGVIEQIQAENPQQSWPKTYTVQSRPLTNAAKIHVYFRHTAYSIAAFKKLGRGVAKEISAIRDLSKPVDERGLHPNRYDLKGSGKGGFVIAAGGFHDNGEQYTRQIDAPVIDIPNWLIDWFVADIRKYRDAIDETKRLALLHKNKVNTLSPRKRAALQRENNPNGFIISKSNTYSFLRAKARHFAKNGLPSKLIRQYLLDAAPRLCHDGVAFVTSEEGQRAIERIVKFAVVDESEGWLDYNYDDLNVAPSTTIDTTNGIKIKTRTSREELLRNIGQDFPPAISTTEVYKAFSLDPANQANRTLAGRVMKALGYKSDLKKKMGGNHIWRLPCDI